LKVKNMDHQAQSPGTGHIGRRSFIGIGSSTLLAAVGGARGEGKAQTGSATSDFDPGPENIPIRDASPNTFLPPKTDHGEVQTFWSTFSAAHRRIQDGGWSRQVTVADFPISKDIAGVNMRLTAGGIRELHWHQATEWAIMLSGRARITAIDYEGKAYVKDVGKDDLWLFPSGIPHSIQGLAPDGCEFLLVFDDGTFSEGNTTLLSDWLRHTPPEILAMNWGVDLDATKPVYDVPPDGRYIFQAVVPKSIDDDQTRRHRPAGTIKDRV
jgi:oxalate decarboxylase